MVLLTVCLVEVTLLIFGSWELLMNGVPTPVGNASVPSGACLV